MRCGIEKLESYRGNVVTNCFSWEGSLNTLDIFAVSKIKRVRVIERRYEFEKLRNIKFNNKKKEESVTFIYGERSIELSCAVVWLYTYARCL